MAARFDKNEISCRQQSPIARVGRQVISGRIGLNLDTSAAAADEKRLVVLVCLALCGSKVPFDRAHLFEFDWLIPGHDWRDVAQHPEIGRVGHKGRQHRRV